MSYSEYREIEKDSDYPPLTLPTFTPEIPVHLLDGLTPEMRYLFEQQSVQCQQLKWLCEASINTNQQVRKTNGRLKKVERWKDKLTSFGTLVLTALVILSSLSALVTKYLNLSPLNK